MSRGLGRQQRAVLEAIHTCRHPVSVEAVGKFSGTSTLTAAERESIRRAMRTLARDGRIETSIVNDPVAAKQTRWKSRWILVAGAPASGCTCGCGRRRSGNHA